MSGSISEYLNVLSPGYSDCYPLALPFTDSSRRHTSSDKLHQLNMHLHIVITAEGSCCRVGESDAATLCSVPSLNSHRVLRQWARLTYFTSPDFPGLLGDLNWQPSGNKPSFLTINPKCTVMCIANSSCSHLFHFRTYSFFPPLRNRQRQTLEKETLTCAPSEQEAPRASALAFPSRSISHFIQSLCQPTSQSAPLLSSNK